MMQSRPTLVSQYLVLFGVIFILAGCASNQSANNYQANKDGQPKKGNQVPTTITSLIAKPSIYLAEIFASKSAEKELEKFRTGKHDGAPVIFREDSIESKELFEGKYYQALTAHLIEELAKWYNGKIPASGGLFLQGNSFRTFSPSDAIPEMLNGIDMADIIGTFTYYVRATTENGVIHFSGINKLSLESYSGENYLRHGLVNNPEVGPLSSTTQIFEWQANIPEKYLQ